MDNHQSILVISNTADLAEKVRQAVGGAVRVDQASGAAEGLIRTRELHPDIVIVGEIGPETEVLKYYRDLREGWISRHSTILVVSRTPDGQAYRILGDKEIALCTSEYAYVAGSDTPPIPPELLPAELKEIISQKMAQRRNKLKASITDPSGFCLTWEQIPGLGAFEIRQETVLENARKAARGGKVCAISIVDNPGGNPAIATEILCSEIRKVGIEPMVHLAFRDRNRNQVESLLYQLAALDVNNLLVLTGDYPSSAGFTGRPKPVFDIDSVSGLQLIKEMNLGMEHEIMRKKTRLAPTEFFTGVAVSPFKHQEAEVMGQYYKLKKKIESGADFAITQIGYDARKLHELQLWLQHKGYSLPVLVSIQVLSLSAARAMHENRVPGCVVTDKLLAQNASESGSPDKGKKARLDRSAKLYAVSRGLGFRGACLSGQGLTYEDVEYIIDKGQELAPAWRDLIQEFDYPQTGGFYYFIRDPQSGLNREIEAPRTQKPVRPVIFILSLLLHRTIFEPKSLLFKPMQAFMRAVDSSRIARKAFHTLEYWIKTALYGCKDCGDCALYDVAYLCPVSQCPKDQRNAPCGGSYYGWCEVYPGEKQCIWVRAYQRLKSQGKEDSIGEYIVPPCNWDLWQTSSWVNYFLGRDHLAKRAGIKPPEKKR